MKKTVQYLRDLEQTCSQHPFSKSSVSRSTGLSRQTIQSFFEERGNSQSLGVILQSVSAILKLNHVPLSRFNDLGLTLAQHRKTAGISQRAMALYVGCSHPTIVALERRSQGRMVTLHRYVEVIGATLSIEQPSTSHIRRLVPPSNEAHSDIVMTPLSLAKSIIDSLPVTGDVLDPCRGEGSFHNQFPHHVSRHWCEITEGRDFMLWQRPVDWIVGNPPWSKFRSFLEHSLSLSDNVCLLASLNHFTTSARVRAVNKAGFGVRRILLVPTPASWPASGFQTAAVCLQRNWHGGTDIQNLD